MTPDPPTQAERPARVAIPEALAAEVAARMREYRPACALGDEVLVLLDGNPEPTEDIVGRIGAVEHGNREGTVVLLVVVIDGALHGIGAWALVGSAGVPDDHPVKVGDRVLVLDAPSRTHHGRVGIVRRHLPPGGVLVDFDPEHPAEAYLAGTFAVTRWAILPPAPDAEPPYVQDHVRRAAARDSAGVTAAHLKARRAVEDMAAAHREQLAEAQAATRKAADDADRWRAEAEAARAQVGTLTAERDRYREALAEIAGGRTLALGETEAARYANVRRDLAREALGGGS